MWKFNLTNLSGNLWELFLASCIKKSAIKFDILTASLYMHITQSNKKYKPKKKERNCD